MANNLPFENERPQKQRKPLYPRAWGSGNMAYVETFNVYSMAALEREELEIGDKIILPQSALSAINRLRLPFPLIFEIRPFKRKHYKSSYLNNDHNNLNSNQNSGNNDEILKAYERRITDIYRTVNPNKIGKIAKWINKYQDNPHEMYVEICDKYGITPKPKISNTREIVKNKDKKSFKQYCSVFEFSSPNDKECYIPYWMMHNIGVTEGDSIELQTQFGIPKGNFVKLLPKSKDFLDIISAIGTKEIFENALLKYSALSINERDRKSVV